MEQRRGVKYSWTMLHKREVGIITQFEIPLWMREYANEFRMMGYTNICSEEDEGKLAQLLTVASLCFLGGDDYKEWFKQQFMKYHYGLLEFQEPNPETSYENIVSLMVYRLGWIS